MLWAVSGCSGPRGGLGCSGLTQDAWADSRDALCPRGAGMGRAEWSTKLCPLSTLPSHLPVPVPAADLLCFPQHLLRSWPRGCPC